MVMVSLEMERIARIGAGASAVLFRRVSGFGILPGTSR